MTANKGQSEVVWTGHIGVIGASPNKPSCHLPTLDDLLRSLSFGPKPVAAPAAWICADGEAYLDCGDCGRLGPEQAAPRLFQHCFVELLPGLAWLGLTNEARLA